MSEGDKEHLRGPHQDREFELMDAGEKHVALFYDIIPEEYEDYKKRPEYGAIEWSIDLKHKGKTHNIPYRILFRKSHEAQANRLFEIHQIYRGIFDPKYEREIGNILGYSAESIEYFIESWSGPKVK